MMFCRQSCNCVTVMFLDFLRGLTEVLSLRMVGSSSLWHKQSGSTPASMSPVSEDSSLLHNWSWHLRLLCLRRTSWTIQVQSRLKEVGSLHIHVEVLSSLGLCRVVDTSEIVRVTSVVSSGFILFSSYMT